MACCILAAYIIHRSLKAWDLVNFQSNAEILSEKRKNESDLCETIYVDDEEIVLQHLLLSDLTCESCCEAVEESVRNLPGLVKITTSLLLSSATVVYKRRLLRIERITATVRNAGYGATIQCEDADFLEALSKKKELARLKRDFYWALLLSIIAWVSNHAAPLSRSLLGVGPALFLYLLTSLVPAWIVQLWFGKRMHLGAWWHGDKTNMDILLSSSILLGLEISLTNYLFGTGALLNGSKDSNTTLHTSNALLVTVILGGRYLCQTLKAKATSKVAALHALRGSTEHAILLPQNKRQPVFLLQANDRILIPGNSVIPCDCYVAAGTSSVDQSLMTGEAALQTKRPGHLLMSGSTNRLATLEAVVTNPPENSSLSRLIEAVRASIASSDEITTDEFPWLTTARTHFTRLIFIIAAIEFLLAAASLDNISDNWMLAWQAGSRRAMLILSVACPCSLGLATPAAAMAGINASLRHGILVTGGLGTLRKLAAVTTAAFDKTGTLTQCGLEVATASFLPNVDHEKMCRLLCAVERDEHTKHIIGRAIFRWAYEQSESTTKSNPELTITKNLRNAPGKGVTGQISLTGGREWTDITVGSIEWLQERGIVMDSEQMHAHSTSTKLAYIAVQNEYAGYLALEVTVRPDARESLARLRKAGLAVCLITGDNRKEAERVAKVVEIPKDQIFSEALPWDKEATVKDLQRGGSVVAMIGDGLNDLPAQSAADISVSVCAGDGSGGLAMGTALSTLADVTLLPGTGLTALPEVFHIAKRTVRQARINLAWAVVYNLLGILAAIGCFEPLGVKLDVSMTGIMMAMSSISVMLLSQRVS